MPFPCASKQHFWHLLFISVFKLFHMLYSPSSLFVRISYHWKSCFFSFFYTFWQILRHAVPFEMAWKTCFEFISCKLGIHIYYYKLKRSFIRNVIRNLFLLTNFVNFPRSTPRTKICRWTFCVEIKGPISWCQFLLHKWIDLSETNS